MGALLLVNVLNPISARGEILSQALKAAYENSDLLAKNRAVLRMSDEDYITVIAKLRPVISYALESQTNLPSTFQARDRDNVLKASLSASWLILDFGKTALNTEATAELIGAARQTLLALEQTVFLNAVKAYFAYRSGLENIALADNNLTLIGEHLRAAHEHFNLGNVTRTDVAQAEARLAEAKAQLALARGNGEVARQAYQLAIGHNPPKSLTKTALSRLPFKSVEAAMKHAIATHPAIKAQQHLVKARALWSGGANIAMRPTLNLSTSVSRDDIGANKINQNLRLTLSGTIYSGGAFDSAKRKAVEQYNSEIISLHLITKQVSQGAANSWAYYEIARQQKSAAKQSVRANEIAYKGVRAEANLGTRTTLDILNAEQTLLDAKNEFN